MWICIVCQPRNILRGATFEMSPRSNSSARRSNTKSTNNPGSVNGKLISCVVSAFPISYAARVDVFRKCQGMRSSMAFIGWRSSITGTVSVM